MNFSISLRLADLPPPLLVCFYSHDFARECRTEMVELVCLRCRRADDEKCVGKCRIPSCFSARGTDAKILIHPASIPALLFLLMVSSPVDARYVQATR